MLRDDADNTQICQSNIISIVKIFFQNHCYDKYNSSYTFSCKNKWLEYRLRIPNMFWYLGDQASVRLDIYPVRSSWLTQRKNKRNKTWAFTLDSWSCTQDK